MKGIVLAGGERNPPLSYDKGCLEAVNSDL